MPFLCFGLVINFIVIIYSCQGFTIWSVRINQELLLLFLILDYKYMYNSNFPISWKESKPTVQIFSGELLFLLIISILYYLFFNP